MSKIFKERSNKATKMFEYVSEQMDFTFESLRFVAVHEIFAQRLYLKVDKCLNNDNTVTFH